MSRREEGFTLIEIMVVITIIAVLASMVTLVIPIAQKAQKKSTCQNNLKQIGSVLAILNTGNKMHNWSGAPFLLQIKDKVNDEDLEVFWCPGDPTEEIEAPERGTQAFIDMYRKMDMKGEVKEYWTSYAGPNWKDYPKKKAGTAARKTRLWGCDKCRNGAPHHDGICVLYDSTKVGFLEMEDLEGHDPELGEIYVGPSSPDERLKQMIFFPPH